MKRLALFSFFWLVSFSFAVQAEENPLVWRKVIPLLIGEKGAVDLKWSLARTQKVSALEVWRAVGEENFRRIEKLPPIVTYFRDFPLPLGSKVRYRLVLVGPKGATPVSLGAPVLLPPRSVDPVKNGRMAEYNRRFLAKALEWKLLTPEEAEKISQELLSLTQPLGEYLWEKGILDSQEVEWVQKGRKEWYREKGEWKSRFLEGIGPAPKRPQASVEKMKTEESPYPLLVVRLRWELSPDDGQGNGALREYHIWRKGPDGEKVVAKVPRGSGEFIDRTVQSGLTYTYRIGASDGKWTVYSPPLASVQVTTPWLSKGKAFVGVAVLLFTAIFGFFLFQARAGKKLYLRRIEGLNAIEEAIGRATEMGKPVLYVPGIDDIQELQTVASLIILSHVSKVTALYRTPIIVPCRDSVVMTMAEEVVQESALAVGRADTFNPDNIRYLSTDQFAYVAGVDGIMLREKPAANLYLGSFFAESLILAETGYEAGAIQVAGTANYHQLPFFIVACDFTIIGEEFYAASAYLSDDPQIVSSIKAADYFKILVILFIVVMAIGVHYSHTLRLLVQSMVGKG